MFVQIMIIATFIFLLAPLAKGQRGICHGSSSVLRASVRPSVNSFLVSMIETTFLNQSGPNLPKVFMATRSRISSIMSEIGPSNSRVNAPEILKIAVFDLVSTIETTFLNQPGPKLHKVFIDTRSWMSSRMSKIGPVTQKLFALELLKIAVLNLFSAIETTFPNQSGPKLHKVFIGTRSQMSSIMSKIRWGDIEFVLY